MNAKFRKESSRNFAFAPLCKVYLKFDAHIF